MQPKTVPLAALRYYPAAQAAVAIYDHQALSSAKDISNLLNAVLELPVRKDGPLDVALGEFDRLCQLRHAIVHQSGALGVHNSLALKVPSSSPQPSVVSVDALGFQDLAAISHTLVRALNQHLFQSTVNRWAASSVLTMKWAIDSARFSDLCRHLVSQTDVTDSPEAIFVRLGGQP
ncbi:MAG: hypothetical protein JNM69_26400 [Archangium sp.]|nr:hypothetical protein [Archangium sp.]